MSAADPTDPSRKRRIAVTGSSGLIGQRLVESLRGDGHTVHRVVRDRSQATGGDIYWSVADHEIDVAALEGVDAVVHLAGEPIAASRWTPEVKNRILDSRVKGTSLISETVANLRERPAVLVSASAIGFYGDRDDETLTEASPPGVGFLPDVVVAWEAAAEAARKSDIRVVHPRTGIVLSEDGGALGKMLPFFKLGIGGKIGSGKQWMSWISLEDEVRALRHLIFTESLEGPVNLAGPNPVTNAGFTDALGSALHRPTFLPIPGFGPKILYGEMGEKLTLESQRVLPEKLMQSGFDFHHGDVRAALKATLG